MSAMSKNPLLVLSACAEAKLSQRLPPVHLSRREVAVLRPLAEGKHNTVKNYVHELSTKLGAADRTVAVTIGLKPGFLHLDW